MSTIDEINADEGSFFIFAEESKPTPSPAPELDQDFDTVPLGDSIESMAEKGAPNQEPSFLERAAASVIDGFRSLFH